MKELNSRDISKLFSLHQDLEVKEDEQKREQVDEILEDSPFRYNLDNVLEEKNEKR